jgi:hypothetical protein
VATKGGQVVAGNHLESLVAEWYEFKGYFVRRNLKVGRRAKGGYECELDVVAFSPEKKELVHIEPSLDAHTWEERERRYRKKFEAGRKYIPGLFSGIPIPEHIEQIALFVYGGTDASRELAGGHVVFIREFLDEVRLGLAGRSVSNAAVPEGFPLLRTLQFAYEYWSFAPAPSSASSAGAP